MGYVRVKARVINLEQRSREEELEFIVDTGAMYSMVPKNVLTGLGIKATGERKFRMANGEAESFPLGWAILALEDQEVPTLVVFGREGAPALLGVTTLELLGLEVDPVTGKLRPMELMLL